MTTNNAEISSGNVFEDLGFENPDEELAKAELSIQIRHIIESKRLNQEQAGKLLGISQSEVSNLVRGKVGRFTIDRIIKYLNALDKDVEIITRDRPENRPATVLVGAIA